MYEKTKEYEKFIFRDDNREKINVTHVRKLIDSIKARNLLELRPILVNERYEIIDGQHRLLAAKELGVEIYYKMEKGLEAAEVMTMNLTKPWIAGDYLNYYCKHGYQDYIKLKDFMKKNGINLRVALTMIQGESKQKMTLFKQGKFQFNDAPQEKELELCHETIDFIKKMNGFSLYTSSSRFWRALRKLVTHANFDNGKWKENLSKMIERFQAKPTTDDYCRLMMDVYNWRNGNKINLLDEVY